MREIPTPESIAAFESFVLSDEEAVCSMDRRLEFELFSDSDVRAPIVRAQKDTLGDTYRSWLDIGDGSGPVTILGGGLAQFWSAAVTQGTDVDSRSPRLAQSLQPFILSELRRGSHVISPSLWPQDAHALRSMPGVSLNERRGGDHYFLFLDGARSMAAFLESLPRNARKVWLRDQRDADRLALSSCVSELTEEGSIEASLSLADTAARNGDQLDRAVAEWRLLSYMRRPGEQLLIRILLEGEPVAYAAARLGVAHLDVHSFGISSSIDKRKEIYHHMFAAAVEVALLRNSSFLHFGIGHGHPKLIRGCRRVPRSWVEYRSLLLT